MNCVSLSGIEFSASDPASTIYGVLADRLQVKEGAFGGIALLLENYFDPGQLGLVGQHADESGMGNGDKVLVIDPADLHFDTFPE